MCVVHSAVLPCIHHRIPHICERNLNSGMCLPCPLTGVALCSIPCAGAVRVTMKHSNLEVVQGDSVTLPCSFFTMSPLSRLNIIWTRAPFSDPDFPTQVIVFDHGQVIENPSLTGRVGFLGIPWSADIILNNTRISDAGNYRCMVSNPPETGDPGIGELALNVLAPPSLPLCLWDGVTDTGGSVALSCMVAEGVPTPEMRWDKLEPEEISLPINMDGDLSGSVQIVNISSQNSGLYRCSVTNLLGTQNCYVNLSIYSPPASSPGILQGVLLTLSMALVLLALLVLVLWLHRSGQKRKWTEGKEEECYNEIRYTPSLIKRSFV
ncbi:immunoglobulin superfamily member 11 isoform X1 [Salmo trutta]|uniref:immunoglobulin superfamily member 11 isoform X1 n=1 Tax=Salmo trutta TaxID=8032 RepID=UPI001130DEAE|nr:immunoglobulin superfamily member 11-like isoform X1 [Salmo trutta]